MRNISKVESQGEDFYDLLVSMGRLKALRDPMAMMCSELELTPPQLHTLSWLFIDGALAMGEIARRVGVTEKTITGVIDRLERDQLVERVRDEQDRRVVHVQLTPNGRKQAQQLTAMAKRSLEHLLALLDPADRASLLKIFHKLHDRLAGQAAGLDPKSKETEE